MDILQNHLGRTGIEGSQEICVRLLGISLLPRKLHLDKGFVYLKMPETIQFKSENRGLVSQFIEEGKLILTRGKVFHEIQ